MTKREAKRHAHRIAANWVDLNLRSGCVLQDADSNEFEGEDADKVWQAIEEIVRKLDDGWR